jgi:DNA-3-methyladenine glycosylase
MQKLRGKSASELITIANGPGKLCKAMEIDMTLYGANLVDPASPLQVWEPLTEKAQEVEISRRRGITKAADWELRFTFKGNPYVS